MVFSSHHQGYCKAIVTIWLKQASSQAQIRIRRGLLVGKKGVTQASGKYFSRIWSCVHGRIPSTYGSPGTLGLTYLTTYLTTKMLMASRGGPRLVRPSLNRLPLMRAGGIGCHGLSILKWVMITCIASVPLQLFTSLLYFRQLRLSMPMTSEGLRRSIS